jgi:hypothetical protein
MHGVVLGIKHFPILIRHIHYVNSIVTIYHGIQESGKWERNELHVVCRSLLVAIWEVTSWRSRNSNNIPVDIGRERIKSWGDNCDCSQDWSVHFNTLLDLNPKLLRPEMFRPCNEADDSWSRAYFSCSLIVLQKLGMYGWFILFL